MTNAPANWYPAPDKPGQVRWWNGEAWTDDYAEANSPAVHAAAVQAKKQAKLDARAQKHEARTQHHDAVIFQRQQTQYESELAKWQAGRDEQAQLVDLVTNFTGSTDAQGLMLKPGEALFASVATASLIEDRAGRGEFVGRSQGVSIPIGSIGGRSVRYHVGAARGHYVAAPPVPTAIDHGNLFITNQRAIFQGAKATRECLYSKLVSYQTSPNGMVLFSVSNRQKPTVVSYGKDLASWFDLRLELALAHFRNTLPDMIARVQSDLASIDAQRPTAPVAAIQPSS